jgi:hypothetical protein
VHGAVRELQVRGQVAEQVDGQRRRPQQVGPQPLVVEALARLDDGRSCFRRRECARRDEVRAGLARVLERQPAPEEPRRLVAFGASGCVPIGCPCASRQRDW